MIMKNHLKVAHILKPFLELCGQKKLWNLSWPKRTRQVIRLDIYNVQWTLSLLIWIMVCVKFCKKMHTKIASTIKARAS